MSRAVTRFAPSPTGHLHLGHAYSALFAERAAVGGRFLLRIEDIDPVRCKPAFIADIYEDLHWLGLNWEEPVRVQSEHMSDYQAALTKLDAMGVLYPCFCTRKEISESANAPHDVLGPVYPGTCRALSFQQRQDLMARKPYVWRLDSAKAFAMTGALRWRDVDAGEQTVDPSAFGDVVLARKAIPASYHLSVTVDDHLQGVTLVTRGEDLFHATPIHRLLQALLGCEAPLYQHHKLLRDEKGERFAKRNHAVTLRALRESGVTSSEIKKRMEIV